MEGLEAGGGAGVSTGFFAGVGLGAAGLDDGVAGSWALGLPDPVRLYHRYQSTFTGACTMIRLAHRPVLVGSVDTLLVAS